MSGVDAREALVGLRRRVPLAAHTTFGVGGAARFWVEAADTEAVAGALAWAEERGIAVEALGGGSNLLVADRGLDALVLRPRMREVRMERRDGELVVDAGAGHAWDDLVRLCVAEGAAGLECLAGIPGEVGAAPIQNIGAYGQEVSSAIESVSVVERPGGSLQTIARADCRFDYRQSRFKREPGRHVVVAVRLRLTFGGAPTVAYPELASALAAAGKPQTLEHVRQTVIALRRNKSMVLDPSDENFRSAGSFFVNPTVDEATASAVEERAAAVCPGQSPPRYAAGPGRVKLPAAWLIERAGMPRGTTRGRVGLSTRHTLAVVNRGGASAREIVAFAGEVRTRVRDAFGVALEPEVRLLGFEPHELAPLAD